MASDSLTPPGGSSSDERPTVLPGAARPTPSERKTIRSAPSTTPPQGQSFGKYVLTHRLGAGGMGEVWRGWDGELQRWVAVKFLKGGGPGSDADEEVARFQREARTAGQLAHPNIAAIYEVGAVDGRHFIAMQLIEGRTLKSFPRGNRRLLAALARDASRAVQFAHERGIVHRDLKPDNLMVADHEGSTGAGSAGSSGPRSPHLYVMDFGLARSTDVGSGLTVSGMVIGTPNYMAPEQARGEAVDARADVWSLGASLYEMLTGRVPFQGGNVYDTIVAVQESEPPAPRQLESRIERDLETVVLKCLEKDPTRRYATAGELADDLDRYLQHEPILAHAPSTFYRLRKRIARNPWAWRLAAAAILAALTGALAVLTVLRGAGREREAIELVRKAERAYDLGDYPEASRLLGDAQGILPAHPDVRHWTSRLALRRYLASRGVPEARMTFGAIELVEPRPESGEERALREEAARGLEGSDRPIVQGILALWSREPERALEAFARVPDDVPAAWEIRFYRGVAQYLAGRFDDARDLISDQRLRDKPMTLPVWIHTLLGLSYARVARGENILPILRQALDSSEELGGATGSLLKARTLVLLGNGMAARGDPSDDLYREAVALLSGRDDLEARVIRSEALFCLGMNRYLRGEADLDDPGELGQAIRELEVDLGTNEAAYAMRARARRTRWAAQEMVGRGRTEDLEGARRDFERAVELAPRQLGIQLDLLETRRSAAGRSPRDKLGVEREQIRALDALIGSLGASAAALTKRGECWESIAQLLEEMGEPFEEEYVNAFRDYAEALRRNPASTEAYHARGRTRQNLAGAREALGGNAADEYLAAIADFSAAIRQCETAAHLYRYRAVAHHNYAQQLRGAGRDAQEQAKLALEDAEAALRLAPTDPGGHHVRSLAWQLVGMLKVEKGEEATAEFARAVEDADAAVRGNPVNPQFWQDRARLRTDQAFVAGHRGRDVLADYALALEDLNRSISLNSTWSEALRHRAAVHQSIAAVKAGRGLDPSEDFAAALRDLDEAIRRNPADWQMRLYRATARQNRAMAGGEDPVADYEAALADLDEAVRLNARAPEAWSTRGLVRMNLSVMRPDPESELRRAIEDLDRALALNASEAGTYRERGLARQHLAKVLEELGRDPGREYEKAFEDFRKSLDLNPRDAETWKDRAQTQQNLGAFVYAKLREDPRPIYENAIRLFDKSLELNPLDSECWEARASTRLNLAVAKRERGSDPRPDYALGAADCEQALKLNPRNVDAVRTLVSALQMTGLWNSKLGEPDEAWYRKALDVCESGLSRLGQVPDLLIDRAGLRLLLMSRDKDHARALRDGAKADLLLAQKLDPSVRPRTAQLLRAIEILESRDP